MKKITKLSLIIIAIICLSVYGVYFTKNQKKVNAERFITVEKELLTEIDSEIASADQQLIKTKQNKQEILSYVPLNKKNAPIKALKEQQNDLATSLLKKETGTLKLVVSSSPKSIQKNITTYQHYYQIYRWNQQRKSWEATDKKKATATLINNLTQQPLTLGNLFINQQNLLLLTRNIQEELLKKTKDPKKDVLAILNLPTLLDSQTTFNYSANKLEVLYKGDDHYLSSYTIDYQTVGAYLNPDFVDQKYIAEAPAEENTPTDKVVALTFDDGPNDSTTPQILKVLKKQKVPATFFMLGSQVEKFPKIVKDIHDQGHVLANHSFDHPDLTTLPAVDTASQINRTQAAIYQATGVLPKYVRPPYGNFDYPTAVTIGLPIVNWSVDSADWMSKDAKKIKKEIKQQTTSQSIILMHDIYQATADSLEGVIKELKKEGYEFVTITDLLDNQTKPLTTYYQGNDQRPIIKP